jgi:hypothetical protein
MDDVSRSDFNRRLEAVVPFVVNLPALDRMFPGSHLSSLHQNEKEPPPEGGDKFKLAEQRRKRGVTGSAGPGQARCVRRDTISIGRQIDMPA